MNQEEINDLIHKYQSGTITPEEKAKLEGVWQRRMEDESYINSFNISEQEQIRSEIFEGVKSKILQVDNFETSRKLEKPQYSVIYKIAASFAVIVISSLFFYHSFIKEDFTTHITAYGEVSKVTLPDSSVVILNGNSSIRYKKAWNDHEQREVWLNGEAYFSVTHTESHQKFVVNTSKKVEIEVLGTEFNVTDRKAALRVVLNSGKVKLNIQKTTPEEVYMKPGNLVEFKENNENYEKRNVNTKVYTAWTSEKLVFDNHTLKEISDILSETYGVKIEFSNPSLLKETFSASVSKNNIDVLVIALSKSFGLKAVKEKNTIIMTEK